MYVPLNVFISTFWPYIGDAKICVRDIRFFEKLLRNSWKMSIKSSKRNYFNLEGLDDEDHTV